MWAISLGHPATEIAHFERMGLESRLLEREKGTAYWCMPTITLLLTLCFPSLVPFLSLSFLFSFLSFTPFITYFSHIFFISCFFFSPFLCSPPFSPVLPPLCTVKALFYTACRDGFSLFCPLTAFILVQVSFPDHSLVCQLPSHHHFPVLLCHHHFPMLAMPYSIPRQKECCFVFLLSVAFPSG